MMQTSTDWDAYYRRIPKYTQFSRALSSRKLIATLRPHLAGRKGLTVCEPGGANSCFMEPVMAAFDIARYHVIDLNDYGLELTKNRRFSKKLSVEKADIRAQPSSAEQFDLVYSVGLIEHFDPADTALAIDQHFARCKPGGAVLLTFPTPTLPYRVIRSAAEKSGRWLFHDERPLASAEVAASCSRHGEVVHHSINWWIGLTQGYLLARKSA